MTTIITGNFQQQDAAQQALSDLEGAGFAADQTAPCWSDRLPA